MAGFLSVPTFFPAPKRLPAPEFFPVPGFLPSPEFFPAPGFLPAPNRLSPSKPFLAPEFFPLPKFLTVSSLFPILTLFLSSRCNYAYNHIPFPKLSLFIHKPLHKSYHLLPVCLRFYQITGSMGCPVHDENLFFRPTSIIIHLAHPGGHKLILPPMNK